MHKFHLLIPINHDDNFIIKNSNLASIRLRVVPCINTLRVNNFEVTYGEFISHRANVVIIGKIGSHDINSRCVSWLSEISHAKSRGAYIFLDYTDHHLGFDGSMTQFYESAIKLTDHCIVPSNSMAILLSKFFNGPISIIEDVIEVSPQPAKVNLVSSSATALWFGHASNISFLIDFINSSEFLISGCNLIVLSNEDGLNIFSHSSIKFINNQQIRLGLWSVSSMLHAANSSDFSIIPSDLSNHKKIGASSNRLITSFALGLPVAADHLPSYQEFSNCYIDLRGPLFSKLINDPLSFSNLVSRAQLLYVDRFKPESIGQQWLTLLVNPQ